MSRPKHWDLLLQQMQVPPDPTQTGSFPSQYLDATCKARKSGQQPQWPPDGLRTQESLGK